MVVALEFAASGRALSKWFRPRTARERKYF
jgi:hypothetical protein